MKVYLNNQWVLFGFAYLLWSIEWCYNHLLSRSETYGFKFKLPFSYFINTSPSLINSESIQILQLLPRICKTMQFSLQVIVRKRDNYILYPWSVIVSMSNVSLLSDVEVINSLIKISKEILLTNKLKRMSACGTTVRLMPCSNKSGYRMQFWPS